MSVDVVLHEQRYAAPGIGCSRLCGPSTSMPRAQGQNSSSPEISKEMVVTAPASSAARIAVTSRMRARKFSISRCSTITPLGLPVEPEVKIT